MKNIKALIKLTLVLLTLFSFTACGEKDENGLYLSPNYCNATINGAEYIDRESYAIPMWGYFPSADLYTDDYYLNSEIIDVTPVMIIHSYLTPVEKNGEDVKYRLSLYIKNFDINSKLGGQTYNFTETSIDNLYGSSFLPFERMWKENINIAIIDEYRYNGEEYTTSATGNISFNSQNQDEQKRYTFNADIILNTQGSMPISLKGYIYTRY